jgi:hypothetical protein
MHQALRSSLLIVTALVVCAGCETHDRHIYSLRKDKDLHTPDPWAPSTTKAADEATSSLDQNSDTSPDANAQPPTEDSGGSMPGQ